MSNSGALIAEELDLDAIDEDDLLLADDGAGLNVDDLGTTGAEYAVHGGLRVGRVHPAERQRGGMLVGIFGRVHTMGIGEDKKHSTR